MIPFLLKPKPALPMSRDIIFKACCAAARASVRRFSRLRILNDPESRAAEMPTSTSVTLIAIVNSSSEKPALSEFFICISTKAFPRCQISVEVCSYDRTAPLSHQHHGAVIAASRRVYRSGRIDRNYLDRDLLEGNFAANDRVRDGCG